MTDEREALRRWRQGQAAAAQRQKELACLEGPRPEQAIAESLAALNALAEMGLWPGPRDPVSERQVEAVRRRWARIERLSRDAAGR
ncbi:MAG: hypothetical protein K8H88_13065 [Sandaracinaceae bacterium]|nr:hypothetical protein [Sandaracinaceae bacterium]